jgi:thiamine kinase-like enzyme
MIPEEKKPLVARALRKAFDVTEFEEIQMLTAGLSSALVFRIVVRGCPYLLRIITRTDAMNDPTRQFACMASGADARLAPRVCYTSVEDRISITDFVNARPFPVAEARSRIPVTLRALHALPPFPNTVKYLDAMDGFVQKFQAAKILPESETEELFHFHRRLRSVYPRNDSEMVSSHNDLKPENVLFDGERVWLVDWEAAFLNDRYHDLAMVANFVVNNREEEEAYLGTYFWKAPSEYQLARFYLMRQILHISYTAVFFLIGSEGKPVALSGQAPSFREFHDRIWSGVISLAGAEAKVQYAWVHMNKALQKMRSARFEDALRTVTEKQAFT